MKKKVGILVAAGIALLAGGVLSVLSLQDKREMRDIELKKAHARCLAVVENRAAELEAWYLRDKRHTADMARELNGMKGKWVMAKTAITKNEAERKAFFRSVGKKYLHSPQDCENRTARVVAEVLRDWYEVENELAVTLNHPELGHQQTEHNVTSTPIPDSDYTPELQKQIAAELVSLVGSEVAAACATRLGISAGILGSGAALSAETFGISLVVGIVVDLGVDWYMDTEGKIKASLDAQIQHTAEVQKTKFRAVMLEALENYMKQWENQL